MMKVPNCFNRGCLHYIGIKQPNGDESLELPYCAAFSEGIPDEIAYGSNKHLKPLKSQTNTIVFAKDKEVTNE